MCATRELGPRLHISDSLYEKRYFSRVGTHFSVPFAGDGYAHTVHVASLYEAASKGRLVHRRFGVVRTTLADAPRVFAQAIEDTRKQNAKVRSFVLCYPHNLTLG